MPGFAGKRVWIIGASAGIGEALARALAAEGARLILSARDRDALDRLTASCPGAWIQPLDLARPETLASAIGRLGGEPLDAVICTAAIYDPPLRVADLEPERVADIFRVNVLGTFEVARLCPPLLRDGGQLVLFGSVAGYFGLPAGQPYSATKAALQNLAESLRFELSPRVDVRLVCPGFVRSRLTAKNDFEMPAIIEPEEAADHILHGLARGGFEIHFPRRFTFRLKVLRMLPYGLAFRVLARALGGSGQPADQDRHT